MPTRDTVAFTAAPVASFSFFPRALFPNLRLVSFIWSAVAHLPRHGDGRIRTNGRSVVPDSMADGARALFFCHLGGWAEGEPKGGQGSRRLGHGPLIQDKQKRKQKKKL